MMWEYEKDLQASESLLRGLFLLTGNDYVMINI